MVKKIIVLLCLALTACTTDPVPDEDFEGPTSHFPLLGNVPDRPPMPVPEALLDQQKRLQAEHDAAIKKQDEVIKSMK